jgi:hypothetical protein
MANLRTLRDLAAFLILMTSVHSALAESLGPISDETPPAVCDSGAFLMSIRCTEDYCDDKQITCHRPFADAVLGRAQWTSFFSEEQQSNTCPSSFAIAGLACNGRFCDRMSLYCVEITNKTFTKCTTTAFVSEEPPNEISVFENPNSDKAGQVFVATGLSSRGSYCDAVSMRVCEP